MSRIKKYDSLKKELEIVQQELQDKKLSYEEYSELKQKQENLIDKMESCPVVYEIWYDDYDGSMSMRESKNYIIERYIDKKKAYLRLDELNNGCNYGRPYYMKVVELDG